jgi:hypothetical protein
MQVREGIQREHFVVQGKDPTGFLLPLVVARPGAGWSPEVTLPERLPDLLLGALDHELIGLLPIFVGERCG